MATQKLPKRKSTFFLQYSELSAGLGMIQFGVIIGIITSFEKSIDIATDDHMDRYYNIAELIQQLYSTAVWIFSISAMLSGFSGPWMANRFGSMRCLQLNNVLGILGVCLMFSAKVIESNEMFLLGIFAIGVNCGLNASLVPMYSSEISSQNVTLGLLFFQVFASEQFFGMYVYWFDLLVPLIFLLLLQLLLLPFCLESPRDLLITKQREEEAREAAKLVEEGIKEIRAKERPQKAESLKSIEEPIFPPGLQVIAIFVIVMQLSRQLRGINTYFINLTSLFSSSGLSYLNAQCATVFTGLVMIALLLPTVFAMCHARRRTVNLWRIGGVYIFGMLIIFSLLINKQTSDLAGVIMLSFTVFFVHGPGSITFMGLEELFSQRPRLSVVTFAILFSTYHQLLFSVIQLLTKNSNLDAPNILKFYDFY